MAPVGPASQLQSKRAPFTGVANKVLCLKYVFVSSPGAHSHNPAKLALPHNELGTFEQLIAFCFSFYDKSTPKSYTLLCITAELIGGLAASEQDLGAKGEIDSLQLPARAG